MSKHESQASGTNALTVAERGELAKLARLRAKVAKNEIDARIATCLASFEAQLAAVYSKYDEHWSTLTTEADDHIKRLDAELAKRCRELGIPEAFRPELGVYWTRRGENASRQRRAELHRVAESRLEAQAHCANLEIERTEAEIIGKIVEAGLTSAAAKKLLNSLPSVQQLVPELALADVESKIAIAKAFLED